MKWIAVVALLALACGDDSSRPEADASTDAGRDSSADSGMDAAMDVGAMLDAEPEPDAGSDAGPADAGSDASSGDAGTDSGPDPDAGTDAGTDAAVDAPGVDTGTSIPVQCRTNADCSGPTASCNREPPGGICLGCAPGSCPSGTTCSVGFGVCVRDCAADTDCAPGWECLGSGRCALIAGCASCPDPYVCNADGRCARPMCPCPVGWTCEAGLCMEP